MMPPRTPFPFSGGRFPTPFSPPPQNTMFPRMPNFGRSAQIPQMNQGGGFLARLFNRGAQAGGIGSNPMQAFGGMNPARGIGALNSARQLATGAGANPGIGTGGGGLLKSLTNPGAVNGFLTNTQQFLKAAQSVGPMVQQYGPLVRNLPAMWKIYRGFKNADVSNEDAKNEESDSTTKKTNSQNTKKQKPIEKKNKKAVAHEESSSLIESSSKSTVKSQKGASVPKLYI